MSSKIGRPRILFASDFSPWAAQAEAYAVCLASTWGASLTVVHVLEFQPGMNPEYDVNRLFLAELRKAATRELEGLTARVAMRGIDLQTRMATGIPSEEILVAARAEDADLIVVGTKGKTGLAHVLLGSTAERVIRTAPCPVLAVRAEQSDQAGTASHPCAGVSLERVLVPVDFSDCSLEALEYAALLAQRSGASLSLLHVLEPVSYGLDFTLLPDRKREDVRARVTQQLVGFVKALAVAKIPADSQVRGGVPADSILDSARTLPADVIVMGTHGRRGLSHALSGSVTEAVLRQSHCPVLTVRSPKFASGHRRLIQAPVENRFS